MDAKKKIKLEYILRASPKIIFNRISTATGLSEWFADDVSINGKIYSFKWGKYTQDAEICEKKINKYVKFKWLENNIYFEFKIVVDEMTNETALIITDFIYNYDEEEETIKLWNKQIKNLKRIIGA